MINSKKKWNKYELDVRKMYKSLGYNTETSRYANRKKDDEKVDLVNTWFVNVQCKHYKNLSVWKVVEVLKEMPRDEKLNIVHAKITNKWSVVILNEKDWIHLLELNKNLKWKK